MNDKKTYVYKCNDTDSKLKINIDSFGDLTVFINDKEYDLRKIIEHVIAVIGAFPCEK